MISGWKCVATSWQEPGPVFPLRAKFQSQKVNVHGDYRTELLLTVTDHVGTCVYVDICTYMCMYEWICKYVWEAMACGWDHGALKRDCCDSMTCTVKLRNLRRWEGKTKRTVHKPFTRAPNSREGVCDMGHLTCPWLPWLCKERLHVSYDSPASIRLRDFSPRGLLSMQLDGNTFPQIPMFSIVQVSQIIFFQIVYINKL